MKYRILVIIVSFSMIFLPVAVRAEGVKTTGMTVTPVRQEISVAAGKSTPESFMVANQTDKPMKVSFFIKQFSATNFTYDYVFHPAGNDWLRLGTAQVELKPKESRKISYSFNVPKDAKPGGNYYMIFASTDIIGPGLPATVQATISLFLTVEGKLVRTGTIENPSIPWLVTGTDIPYKFNARNTGNVYYSAYLYGQVAGLFGKQPAVGVGHVLMPQVARTISGSVPAPVIPGVYKVTYGYKTDFGTATTQSAYVLFLPIWSVAALAFLLVAGIWLFQRIRHRKTGNKTK